VTEQLGTKFPVYRTSPAPCPYLPGRFEQKAFARLSGPGARKLNEDLAQLGFRRSQNIAYKPICDGCRACISVRIRVAGFAPTNSQRRVAARNADLHAAPVEPWATDEQFSILRRYLDARHKGGGMSEMTMFDYVAMVEDSAVDTHLVEYRLQGPGGAPGALAAVCLADTLRDGLSMVYSYYDVALAPRSLGTFMVLEHVARARQMGLPYVYLGYYIQGSRKMEYKARFGPLEARMPGGWEPFDPNQPDRA
jgi:leucyl-tRNA---protein transferase